MIKNTSSTFMTFDIFPFAVFYSTFRTFDVSTVDILPIRHFDFRHYSFSMFLPYDIFSFDVFIRRFLLRYYDFRRFRTIPFF